MFKDSQSLTFSTTNHVYIKQKVLFGGVFSAWAFFRLRFYSVAFFPRGVLSRGVSSPWPFFRGLFSGGLFSSGVLSGYPYIHSYFPFLFSHTIFRVYRFRSPTHLDTGNLPQYCNGLILYSILQSHSCHHRQLLWTVNKPDASILRVCEYDIKSRLRCPELVKLHLMERVIAILCCLIYS